MSRLLTTVVTDGGSPPLAAYRTRAGALRTAGRH